jgi:hypothetical protein
MLTSTTTTARRPALDAFLGCAELDELADRRAELGALDAGDIAAIDAVIYQWSDLQALANVLMYPELIARPQLVRHLLHALEDADHDYLALAAIVGLQPLGHGFFPEQHREQLAAVLIARLGAARLAIAHRASVTLVSFLGEDEVGKVAPFLDHPDAAVRHNVVVAIVAAVGVAAAGALVHRTLAQAPLGADARASLVAQAAELDTLIAAGDADQVRSSRLGAPLLAYLPNLADWPAASR